MKEEQKKSSASEETELSQVGLIKVKSNLEELNDLLIIASNQSKQLHHTLEKINSLKIKVTVNQK
ncbi:hypothetical protein NSA03_02770 [Lactobacillus taiwanensis]|uniref:hypothetical protein n=1 Tax=Lactobacillus taiwanensis TaxID=508451 RepID=UPI00214B23A6|nr:hypothetical protein [Lactobacillus taiwanensis]MCR1916241.1 hypothetical protein [Lactobacillus taiwanensis]